MCAPVSRYLLIKLFPDLSLQRFLDAYFWLIGSLAVAGNLVPPLRHAVWTGVLGFFPDLGHRVLALLALIRPPSAHVKASCPG